MNGDVLTSSWFWDRFQVWSPATPLPWLCFCQIALLFLSFTVYLNTVRYRCLLYIAGLGAGLARSLDCRFVWLISDLWCVTWIHFKRRRFEKILTKKTWNYSFGYNSFKKIIVIDPYRSYLNMTNYDWPNKLSNQYLF